MIIENKIIGRTDLEAIYWDEGREEWTIEADNQGFIGFKEFEEYIEGEI